MSLRRKSVHCRCVSPAVLLHPGVPVLGDSEQGSAAPAFWSPAQEEGWGRGKGGGTGEGPWTQAKQVGLLTWIQEPD